MSAKASIAVVGLWLCGCYAAPSIPSEPPTADLDAADEPSPWVPWAPPAPTADDEGAHEDAANEVADPWRGELHATTSAEHPQRLAVWTTAGVLVSMDDGASFERIFAGASRIWDVALDDERVWVLLDRRLHRRNDDGSEESWPMPPHIETDQWFVSVDDYGTAPRLAVSSNWAVIAGPHPDVSRLVQLVGRHRRGQWRTSLAESAMDSASVGVNAYRDLRVDERGRAEVTVDWGQGTECGVTYVSTYRGRLGHQALRLQAEYEDPFEQYVAHDELVYGYCPDRDDEQLCVHPLTAARPQLDGGVELPWVPIEPETQVVDQLDIVRNRTQTLAVVDRRLLALDGGRAKTLATDAPADAELLTVDTLGRPLFASGGAIARWTPGEGWSWLRYRPDLHG